MRVIAGRLGGRRLAAPRGQATRPTSDRVREALFSVLGDVSGAHVLDLFAGTGALGIEALSRGARRVVFVESARPALAILRQNLADLGLGNEALVVGQPVAKAAAAVLGAGEPFDLVFADPPYAALAEVPPLLDALVEQRALAPGAVLSLEHASRDAPPALRGLAPRPSRRYGDTTVTLYDAVEVPG
jgi:16S rRNA (guanine966-N2)-methyltransferase